MRARPGWGGLLYLKIGEKMTLEVKEVQGKYATLLPAAEFTTETIEHLAALQEIFPDGKWMVEVLRVSEDWLILRVPLEGGRRRPEKIYEMDSVCEKELSFGKIYRLQKQGEGFLIKEFTQKKGWAIG